ncbi:disks large-associated protein 5 [Eublepharis macularius]|uniref:Disks large-associated protein 5 n=1 Tax=Eublepharis macularius TaxID=481883 RepID=A0AA97KRN1_EUBMA|nr:disks large-associated protein 5 [Eublepharis macularius]
MSKMATNFAARYKKDLSTETLKTKLVRRKSILQKESRHKHFNKVRQFGLADVNTQYARDKELSQLEEAGEGYTPEKSKAKPSQIPNAKTCGKERMEMLQRYKAEKELRKLKEQRQKPVFKCGRYKPEMPSFLPQASLIPVLSKSKEKAAPPPPVRVTRSKAKNILEETTKALARPQVSAIVPKQTSKGSGLQPLQHRQQHIYVDKPAKKENKVVQPSVPPTSNGRITRATAAAMSKIPQVSKVAATAGNLAQKRSTTKGKQQKEMKNEEALHDMKEDILMEPVKERANFQIPSAEDTEEGEVFLEKENIPTSCGPAPTARRTRSFAPQNFVFKPLEGLATYRVTPMTPSRASLFLSPDLTWSPTQTTSEVPMEDAQDCLSERSSSPVPEVIEEDLPECQSAWKSQEVKTEQVSSETMIAVTSETEISQPQADFPAPETLEPMGEQQHDVSYFRNILRSETERLTSQCLEWDGTAETDIPEDAKDLVRTTIGQTRLLIAERFKQFEGLVDNCEFRRGEKETTCSDLDGFWDMVAFQVEDVNKKFESLRKLQERNWQVVDDDQTKRLPKKKAASQRATRATTGGSAKKTAARKRLAAIKAIMKNKMKQEGVAAEATGQEISKEEEEKVTFDGGFFRVDSPARRFPGQTPKSASRSSRRASRRTSRRASQRTTPRSASRAVLRSCADTCITRLGTPAASKTCPPLPDLDAFLGPAGTDLLSRISDQSDTKASEESGAPIDSVVEDADKAQQTASADGISRCSDTNDLVSVDSPGVESPDVQKEDSDIAEEVQQAATALREEGVVCSPEKDAIFEGTSSQHEEQHTPERKTGHLLGDFSCGAAISEGKPNLDCNLFFTPLKNEAQKFASAVSDNDLIVFSPLSFPVGEK